MHNSTCYIQSWCATIIFAYRFYAQKDLFVACRFDAQPRLVACRFDAQQDLLHVDLMHSKTCCMEFWCTRNLLACWFYACKTSLVACRFDAQQDFLHADFVHSKTCCMQILQIWCTTGRGLHSICAQQEFYVPCSVRYRTEIDSLNANWLHPIKKTSHNLDLWWDVNVIQHPITLMGCKWVVRGLMGC